MTSTGAVRSRTIALVGAGLLLLVMGLAGGHYISTSRGTAADVHAAAKDDGGPGLYTCGMHPNVVQEGPGLCPICKMDLTPLKKSTSGAAKEKKIKYWVAPMDPSFISDKPGKSPMGMDLVPVYEGEDESESAVVIDPSVVQNIGVRTAEVKRGVLAKTVRATGDVVENETRVGIVNLKIDGWIDKVIVDETGMAVAKGDPLLEIYSPQLVTTQEEYLIARNNLSRVVEGAPAEVVDAAKRTLESTRRRLLNWDITDGQIDELDRTGTVRKNMVLRSPFDGVVTMKSALPGQKVGPGTDLYHIADLRDVWVQASVFDDDIPFVHLGQEAVMTLAPFPGKTFEGRVSFVSPVMNRKTRDLSIRVEFPNPGGALRPGMYADVAIRSVLQEDAVLVPEEAVIRTGKRNVVFIARGEGRFVPAEVVLGPSGEDGTVRVLSGVQPGERVVTSAQFLLDSESSFQEAIRKMRSAADTAPAEGAKDAMPGMNTEPAGPAAKPMKAPVAQAAPAAGGDFPFVKAEFEGEPVANAIAVAPDGAITIMCPVMKNTRVIEAGDIYTEYEGMRVYYCCPGCQDTFESDPEKYLAELGEAMKSGS